MAAHCGVNHLCGTVINVNVSRMTISSSLLPSPPPYAKANGDIRFYNGLGSDTEDPSHPDGSEDNDSGVNRVEQIEKNSTAVVWLFPILR